MCFAIVTDNDTAGSKVTDLIVGLSFFCNYGNMFEIKSCNCTAEIGSTESNMMGLILDYSFLYQIIE